ncbi:MAG: GAP family protein [Natronosporangium sp.]
MGPVLGELLPLAVGVAVSPVPIIAVILMLLAPQAGGTSRGFLAGWLAGIVLAVGGFVLVAGLAELGSPAERSALAAWIKLLLGLVVLALGVREWLGRPGPGEHRPLPKWMSAIGSVTTGRAAGLGFALAAVNPKNLAMAVAAGVAIGGGDLPAGQDVVAVVVFTLIAGATVAVPVIGYAVAAERMRGPLDRLKAWLEANNQTVMSVLLLVIGVVLVGKGLAGF